MKFKNDKERLDYYMNKVDVSPESGCWLWTGAIVPNGYGVIQFKGDAKRAHRVFYELVKGSIPDDLDLDHLCRIRNCVNPNHLEPVTRSVNLLRSPLTSKNNHNRKKTHCIYGHEFNLSNTGRDSNGHRYCRECQASYSNRSRKS